MADDNWLKKIKDDVRRVGHADPAAADLPLEAEEALALEFARRHRADLRYVASWNQWMSWEKDHWRDDKTLSSFDRVRALCRETASKIAGPGVKARIASAKTVVAVVTLSRSDRWLAATTDQWDASPDLLGAKGRTVDLATGSVRSPAPADYITKQAAVAPSAVGKTPSPPIWKEFLHEIFAGDADLIAYAQRVAGYCLTGHTREQVLFFLYGTGANGKGVFTSTLAGIMGEYARAASAEMFMESKFDRHPAELATLRGARLVLASEIQSGRRWHEARIKELTGGDTITARFMRGNPFDFKPSFKLMISGNHKPSLRDVDEAVRRRFHLIPFRVTIPPQNRDPQLGDKLKLEWKDILSWAIQGNLEWRRIGLAPPKAVVDATEEYLSQEDGIGQWLEECVDMRDADSFASSTTLFSSWRSWAQSRNEFVGSVKRLTQSLKERGFQHDRTEDEKGFRGLALRSFVHGGVP